MSNFTIKELTDVFTRLGRQLTNPDEELTGLINNEQQYNAWFTPANVKKAVNAIGLMLNAPDLDTWLGKYNIDNNQTAKKIGLILAGNIPLVGFHDILCVLASGNMALIKTSVQDARLVKYLLQKLTAIDDRFGDRFSFVERLENFDAVIATGSNNSSRYFEYYFGKVPHIIRKNRNSVAVLAGNETETQLFNLGHDIFDYYGLGCRNVSKLLIPKDYDLPVFFEAITPYQPVIDHHKYNNNYDYNKSIYLVNGDKHLDNGFLLLKEEERLASPFAVLYYSYYDNIPAAEDLLRDESDKIQCIVSAMPLKVNNQAVDFGKSQQPALWDYADGIDTMEFLSGLAESAKTKA